MLSLLYAHTLVYDPFLLKKMEEKLGSVLKIDAHADDALKGSMSVYVSKLILTNFSKF